MSKNDADMSKVDDNLNNQSADPSVVRSQAVYFFLKEKYKEAYQIEMEELQQVLLKEFKETTLEEIEDGVLLFAIKEKYVQAWYPYYGNIFPFSKRVLMKAAYFDKHFLMKR